MSNTTQIPPQTAAQYARLVQKFRDSLPSKTNGVVELNQLLTGYTDYWGSVNDDKVSFTCNLMSFLSELDRIPDPE